jgi:hypothetical protein
MDFLRIYFDTQKHTLSMGVSPWLIALLVFLVLLGILLRFSIRRYRVVKLDIALGSIGKAEFRPNVEDLQIAHRIWTELVTRKAAIPVDPDHDVIVEVYDSWYTLFTKVRELVANLPADLVRREKSTSEIVRIATATLNEGLRPHLTQWQARFRNWYEANREQLKDKSPQELQKEFPEFNELISDMLKINSQLIAYANELKKLLSR